MTYKACKEVILSGNYNKEEMLDNLDIFLLRKRITKEQYNELIDLMAAAEEEEVNETK